MKDTTCLAGEMRTWADEPELTRILVSHGDVIEEAPGGALRMAAAGLTA